MTYGQIRAKNLRQRLVIKYRSTETHGWQHQVCLMAGDRVARSISKFIYIRVGGQIRWIYPPLNKPKTLAAIFKRHLR
jgi:hypothetical protein